MEITPASASTSQTVSQTDKWQTHLINPHIIPQEPQGFIADATINTPNGHLVASAKHEDKVYTAINDLINKLERQPNKVQHKGEAVAPQRR